MITLKKEDIEIIIDCWRASNRYDAMTPYKTDERLKNEHVLISKLFNELTRLNS